MPPAQPSYVKVTHEPECTRVDFTEKHIIDEVVIRAIGNELTKLIDDTHRPRLVICFKGVEHLSSAALGTLITVNNRVKAKDGHLRLCDINPQILQIFEITKLNRILKIEKDMAAAKASLIAAAKA
ncbi:MAG: STAS domain-containing protein [Phycisphaerales bacterium]